MKDEYLTIALWISVAMTCSLAICGIFLLCLRMCTCTSRCQSYDVTPPPGRSESSNSIEVIQVTNGGNFGSQLIHPPVSCSSPVIINENNMPHSPSLRSMTPVSGTSNSFWRFQRHTQLLELSLILEDMRALLCITNRDEEGFQNWIAPINFYHLVERMSNLITKVEKHLNPTDSLTTTSRGYSDDQQGMSWPSLKEPEFSTTSGT